MKSAFRAASGLLVASLIASCSDGPPKPASIEANSNVNQSVTVGADAAARPSVKVLDNKGNPYAGFPIVFAVTSGGGNLSRTTDTTDANGIATSGNWTIGTTVGPNLVTASGEALDGSPITFTATGTPAAPVELIVQAGDNQTATAGSVVPVAPSVIARDQYGNAVPGVPVTFTVSAGSGSVGTPTVNTNASGIATLSSWTLGTTAGTNRLSVTADGTSGVTITATGQPSAVSAVVVQRQPSGAASGNVLARQPILRLADQFGNVVTGAASNVTASIASGTGTLSGTTTVAAVNGLVTFTNLAVTGTGPTTLSFSASGIANPVVSSAFTVAAAPGAAAQLAVGTQPSGATSAVAFSGQPDVEIRDASGINVTTGSFVVTASLSSATGTLTGTTSVTTVNGVATFTNLAVVGSGSYTINFTASGLTGTSSSTLSVAAPAVAGLEVVAGNRQIAYAGNAVATKPAVRVVGANSVPLAGARVTFAAVLGGGSVTSASVISDADGIARVGNWTLGSQASFNTLTATVEGVGVPGNPVTLSASGCTPGDGAAGYKLTLCFVTDMTASQKAAFTSAAARWESIITKDLEDDLVGEDLAEGSCGSNSYAIPGTMNIDDLLIFAAIVPIDGVGNVLGSAGPCFIRKYNPDPNIYAPGDLSEIGQMRFDQADMNSLEASGQLNSVILHEMGHVLGIGVLWNLFGFLQNPSQVGVTVDTYMNGTNAIQGFSEIGFGGFSGNKVPVANVGGAGTINSHWRESTLNNELMTGTLNNGNNPLTALSIRSLVDLGYTVSLSSADPYPGAASFAVSPSKTGGEKKPASINLSDDVYRGPLYSIDRKGKVRRIKK